MTISSINSNLAALLAQINISNATSATSNDVAALSSGNRIVSASTDVAALAAGTGLASQVNVLNSSISVAAQGSSLLQVADGGLSQIQSILQRQQAITTSAESGSLSSAQLGFLDQEFQALTTEINNIAGQTNFNGVNLLNGSIQGGANVTTNASAGSTVLPSASTIFSFTAEPTAGQTVTVTAGNQPSVTLTFGTATGDVGIGATEGETAANIAAALNNSNLSQLSNVHFTSSGTSTGVVSAIYTGPATSVSTIPAIVGSTSSSNITASTASFTGATIGTFTAAGGDLGVGDTFTVGTHTLTFVATGQATDSTHVALAGTTATTLTALAAELNNAAFSDLSGISFAKGSGNTITASYTGSGTAPTLTTAFSSAAAPTYVGSTATIAATASGTIGTFTGTGNLQAGDTLVISDTAGSATITFGNGADVTVGATQAATLTALATYLTTNDTTTLGFASFSAASGILTGHTAATGGEVLSSTYTPAAARTATIVTGAQITAGGVTGLGAGATSAVGSVTGSLFVSPLGTTALNTGSAIDLSNIANNASFLGSFDGSGSIGAISANYISTGSASTSGVIFSTVVGNDTYTTGLIPNSSLTSTTASVPLLFNGTNTVSGTTEGGNFTINLVPQASNITSQTQASQLAAGIVSGLSGVSASQSRSVLSYNNNYTATVGGEQLATLAGSSLSLNTSSFANPLISSVTVSAPSTGSTDATITAVINGDTYTTIAGIGDTFKTNSQIVLENTSNPAQQLTITTGSTAATGAASGIAVDISSASNAAAFQTALSSALGLNNANAGLTFQVGTSAADTLGISLSSATSSSLFGGQSLNVQTQANATTAATAVANALNTVTALRATVGAAEEQFNFASTALSSAAQNEGAAKSALLDTDVAATSTEFATNQVQLQAGIAVLAQANQLQQNLLKLIS